MAQVFLSYAREDAEIAERLAHLLENRGLDVWWDTEIPPGKTWDDVIGQHLDAADCVLVLWSAASVTSRWVREEAGRGAERGRLLPVFIERVDLPLGFGRIQAADLIGWHGSAAAPKFVALEGAIRGMLEGGAAPPAVPVASARWGRRAAVLAVAAGVLGVIAVVATWAPGRREAWLVVDGVQVGSNVGPSPARIVAHVGEAEFRYPAHGGAEWMELGPDMSPTRFRLDGAPPYEVRFEMALQSGRRFISQDTDLVVELPHHGRYRLHEVDGGTRAAPVSATVSYRVE